MPLTVTRGNPRRVPASIQVLSKRFSPALPPRGRPKISTLSRELKTDRSGFAGIPPFRFHRKQISPVGYFDVCLDVAMTRLDDARNFLPIRFTSRIFSPKLLNFLTVKSI